MKRNQYGMNLDEGIALSTEEEFELLYIESDCQCERHLADWIKNGKEALLFGGQIGCGKTTAIAQAFRVSRKKKPDITFHFDRNDLNLSSLDAWIIIFSQLACFANSKYFSVLASAIPELKEIFGTKPKEIESSTLEVLLENFSPNALKKHQELKKLLEPLLDYLPKIFRSVVITIEEQLKRPLLFLAAGVDKFEPASAAYISLTEPLTALTSFKTLFEVNAVHLFTQDSWSKGLTKVVLTASSQKWIETMLEKRLGIYAQSYQNEIPLLAAFSGGIPRQALRLLDHFISQHKSNMSREKLLLNAIESVNRDFFAFSKRPRNDLLNYVAKNKLLETSYISFPGDSETALNAVFGNWLIIGQQKNESNWAAFVNPVIKSTIENTASDDPEIVLLKKYAAQQGISATGLDINTEVSNWQKMLFEEIEHPIELNITEILDAIANALLSKQRDDRIIVAYENKEIFFAVRAYLEAKSNTYEYQIWQHNTIEGGIGYSPLEKILEFFANKAVDIYSVDFIGDFTEEQLAELNIRRDSFIGKQLIWWIPKNKLNKYLIRWTQLRQLFKVFILEEDLEKTLKIEDIEADLSFMEELVESENTAAFSYVNNLKIVLNYLKEAKHE